MNAGPVTGQMGERTFLTFERQGSRLLMLLHASRFASCSGHRASRRSSPESLQGRNHLPELNAQWVEPPNHQVCQDLMRKAGRGYLLL